MAISLHPEHPLPLCISVVSSLGSLCSVVSQVCSGGGGGCTPQGMAERRSAASSSNSIAQGDHASSRPKQHVQQSEQWPPWYSSSKLRIAVRRAATACAWLDHVSILCDSTGLGASEIARMVSMGVHTPAASKPSVGVGQSVRGVHAVAVCHYRAGKQLMSSKTGQKRVAGNITRLCRHAASSSWAWLTE